MRYVRFEKEVVHPAAALWLESNGYSYEYEPRISGGKIPDFVFRKGNFIGVGECKQDRANLDGTIKQVLDYKRDLNANEAFVFMPASELSCQSGNWESGEDRLIRAGIRAVGLDIPDNKAKLFTTIRPDAFAALSEFSKGLDLDFSTVLMKLIDAQLENGETPFEAAKRIRSKFTEAIQ